MTETQITTTQNGLAHWGSREEVKEIADRLKRFVPGTKKMNDTEIMAYAQLVHMTGLNPCSGEIYGWDSRGDGSGDLITKQHYAILVRWAKSQENFTTKFTCVAIGSRSENTVYECRLLRQSDRALIGQILTGGGSYEDAMTWATTRGIGIVEASEKGKRKPPTGKDWDWVARKRSLEDAIKLAFGKPTTQELARQTWIVDGVETIPYDWQDVTPEMQPAERQATARISALRRLQPPLEETAQESIDLLFGLDDAPPAQKPPEPEPDQSTEEPPPQPEKPAEKALTNGELKERFNDLFTEVNARLEDNGLERYASIDNMQKMLKAIGYTKYTPADHATMAIQLITQKEPNGGGKK